MKKFLIICGIVLVSLGAVVSVMSMAYPSASWRYKVTVEIETPEGLKTGSVVRELRFRSEPKIFPEQPGFNISTRGEAVVIDLGERGIVFGLVSDLMTPAFENPYNHLGHVKDYHKYIEFYDDLEIGKSNVLPSEKWPKFVMFKDINDPKSVVLVRGYVFDGKSQENVIEDNMAELLGNDVTIKTVSVERTSYEVTHEAERWLSWLSKLTMERRRLSGNKGAMKTNNLSDNLGSGSFSSK